MMKTGKTKVGTNQTKSSENTYLAVVAGCGMGQSATYKLLQENEIKHIKYYGEYVKLYELSSDKPLPRERVKKLGLKFETREKRPSSGR
jgi:hypothetical protein